MPKREEGPLGLIPPGLTLLDLIPVDLNSFALIPLDLTEAILFSQAQTQLQN